MKSSNEKMTGKRKVSEKKKVTRKQVILHGIWRWNMYWLM